MNAYEIIHQIWIATGVSLFPFVRTSAGRHPGELVKTLTLAGGYEYRFRIEVEIQIYEDEDNFTPADSFWIGTSNLFVKKDWAGIQSMIDAINNFKAENPYFCWK